MIVIPSINDFNHALISDSSFQEINYQTLCIAGTKKLQIKII